MIFKIEELQKELDNLKESIRKVEQRIKKNRYREEQAILWEIGSLLEVAPNVTQVYWWGKRDIVAYVDPIAYEEFEQITNEIDEVGEAYGYTLDHDNCRGYSEGSYVFAYQKADEDKSYMVTLKSNKCHYVPTGRLVEEKTSVCGMFK